MVRFVCPECGRGYPADGKEYRCLCGKVFEITDKKVSFPLEKISKRKNTIWRYREAIPIESDKDIVSFDEGFTPLLPLKFNGSEVLAKLDFMFPTGSFKDRGSSVMMSFLKGLGVKRVMDDSSGNAGASIAAYAASAGISCEIFCPEYASGGKLTQIMYYGAKLNRIAGTREDAEKAAEERAKRGDVYYASHNWNPYFLEGTKTLAFEIAEQMGWSSPDSIICPCGNGGVYLGLFVGFSELIEQGIVDSMPRLLGVQSSACPPIHNAYRQGTDFVSGFSQTEKTMAEGVCLAKPVRGKLILRALRQSRGSFEKVKDEEVMKGMKLLASRGIFVEPTSAIVMPALEKFMQSGAVGKNEKTVIVLTGSGLKAADRLVFV